MRYLILALAALSFLAPAAGAKPHKTTPRRVHPAAAAVKPGIEAHVIPATAPGLLPDMSLGNPNAPVTVIEYASAACPHCAAWNEEVWPQFQAKYVATGQVRYIFREILTSPQEYALSAFLIGRCAVARAKDPTSSAPYFAVVDTYFRGQKTYYANHNIGVVTAEVKAKTGMTAADISACVADSAAFDAFMKNMEVHAEADGVSSTPTFVINGKAIKGHALEDIDAAIATAK